MRAQKKTIESAQKVRAYTVFSNTKHMYGYMARACKTKRNFFFSNSFNIADILLLTTFVVFKFEFVYITYIRQFSIRSHYSKAE